jgi:hypothetical protein
MGTIFFKYKNEGEEVIKCPPFSLVRSPLTM